MVPIPTLVQVVTDADGRCECTGACGRPHRSDPRGRCARLHLRERGSCLVAAPRDPAVPAHRAWRVPTRDLAAWCQPCLDGARRRARHHTDPTAGGLPALF